MVEQASALLIYSIVSCFDFFGTILDKCGGVAMWFSIIILLLVWRFLLAPVFGAAQTAAGSDMVTRIKAHNKRWGKFEKNNRGRYSR